MLSLGPLSFGAPWLLLTLLAVPLLWWLLRFIPPPPRREQFPAIAFLLGLRAKDKEPARTPLWLLILRSLIAVLAILALAQPLLNPQADHLQSRSLLLVVDDGWSAAAHWPDRRGELSSLADEAGRRGARVALLTTAPRLNPLPLDEQSARAAQARIDALEPVAWAPDRRAALQRLSALGKTERPDIVWITDGIDHGDARAFAEGLMKIGNVQLVLPGTEDHPLLLAPPSLTGNELQIRVLRADSGLIRKGRVQARATDGRVLAETPFAFTAESRNTGVSIALPIELRNAIARIEIAGEASSGAVQLTDGRTRRHAIGLVTGGSAQLQPLLSDLYYLERALQPYADVALGSVDELAALKRPVIVLADVGQLVGSEREKITRFVEEGGLLIRFAGPRLAARQDDLLPVRLREGGRSLGGALSWEQPQALAEFEDKSPFQGLAVPAEVTVSRQVLAEPTADLGERSWARLRDGTPLVTAARRGRGLVVLFHVTANPDWSNLPLSGLYVQMMRRLLPLGTAIEKAGQGESNAPFTDEWLAAQSVLDAFGVPAAPPPEITPLTRAELGKAQAGPRHPPGLYGDPKQALALNVGRADSTLNPLPALPKSIVTRTLTEARTVSLKPWLLTAAALLFLADTLLALMLSGALAALGPAFARFRRPVAGALILVACATAAPAQTENGDAFAIEALQKFRLAYVRTGIANVDAMSAAGLAGLSQALIERTAVEPIAPLGVDLETDELAFFPLLYWQVSKDQPPLSNAVLEKLDHFMKTGGTLVIDTADEDEAVPTSAGGPSQGRGAMHLRTILAALDLPALEPMPADHVLSKSFYLMHEFPGRWAGGQVWVEVTRSEAGASSGDHDGVASIIIGSNDWAAAWARDKNGGALAPIVPGGEEQREQAIRFGINLVMYALTGNYKADQVHVPALLERLGQ